VEKRARERAKTTTIYSRRSVIKENSDVFHDIQSNNTINIQGISKEVTKSKGLVSIEIQTTKYIIPHNFHIVHLPFAIPCEGILRTDFINKYNCQLDFKQSRPKPD